MAEDIVESGNPSKASFIPYIMVIGGISIVAIIGSIILIVFRPEAMDNAILITMIFGFATTSATAASAFMRSTETREVVNSRMDEFKRTLQTASNIAQDKRFAERKAEGKSEGRIASDNRTDQIAAIKEKDKV